MGNPAGAVNGLHRIDLAALRNGAWNRYAPARRAGIF
jgi:hypothetical protein